MKLPKYLRDPKGWGAFFGAGLIVSMAALPQARGELVYEEQLSVQGQAGARVDDRETLRQVINTSEKAQVTQQAQAQVVAPAPVAIAPAQAVQVAQVDVGATSAATELQHLSKTELMRRERMREEMRNEDVLQERLEELRLRDEKRRTDQLMGAASDGSTQVPIFQSQAQAPAPVAASAALQTEVVVAPVTEGGPAPASIAPAQQTLVASAYPLVGAPTSVMVADSVVKPEDESASVSIMLRGGVAGMSSNSAYEVTPQFSTGIGVGFGVTDNLTVEGGYTYNRYGVTAASTNPYVTYVQNVKAYQGYDLTFNTVREIQHVGDAGLRVYFLGPNSKFRPYISGGGGYSKNFVNYDEAILAALREQGLQNMGRDAASSSFLSYLSTGADLKLSKSISLSVLFKYYNVLSARDDRTINDAALAGYYNQNLYNPYGGYYGYGGYNAAYVQPDSDKKIVGGSLARQNFYSMMAGVTFTF